MVIPTDHSVCPVETDGGKVARAVSEQRHYKLLGPSWPIKMTTNYLCPFTSLALQNCLYPSCLGCIPHPGKPHTNTETSLYFSLLYLAQKTRYPKSQQSHSLQKPHLRFIRIPPETFLQRQWRCQQLLGPPPATVRYSFH